MVSPLIEAIDIKKYFKVKGGQLHAVDGISFTINQGETLGVVGESGCGKSTLGRTVIRLIEPTDGEIRFQGENIVSCDKKRLLQLRREAAMIFQDPYASLNPRMSVFELIADPMRINKTFTNQADMGARVHQLMDTVGLARRVENSYPHELDGGRRQRIGVARALALDPKFIVCDEPVSALDVSIQAQILNLLMDLQDELGLTYMFITHDLSVVRHISTHIMVTYLGKCVEIAPSKELFQNPVHPYTKALFSALLEPSISCRTQKMELLQGEVSNPINPKPGCRFALRCPYCTKACTEKDIPLREISSGHKVACVQKST